MTPRTIYVHAQISCVTSVHCAPIATSWEEGHCICPNIFVDFVARVPLDEASGEAVTLSVTGDGSDDAAAGEGSDDAAAEENNKSERSEG